jgi:spore coat protein A
MKRSTTQLHKEIPSPTPIFGYDGTFPGPTFDVSKDTNVVVEWVNEIAPLDPTVPQHILAPVVVQPTADVPFPQDWPGSQGGQPSSAPPAPIWTVVHLHGGTTPPGSDGWPDDAFPYPQSAFYTYPTEPRATMLWYHDHADMITRLNVGAGSPGFTLYVTPLKTSLASRSCATMKTAARRGRSTSCRS